MPERPLKNRTTSAESRSLTVTCDHRIPQVLFLTGDLDAAGATVLDVVGARALAQSSSGLVLDVAAVASVDADGIACFNRLGAAAKLRGATVTIRTPGAHLDAELAAHPLDNSVRTEVTEALPTRRATEFGSKRAEPVPELVAGVPRRAGRGFIESFGEGRTCAARGCTTRLSQYNGGALCSLHDVGGPRSRGTH